jgi:hypothetical protein
LIERANLDQTLVGRAAQVRGRPASLNVGDNSSVEL